MRLQTKSERTQQTMLKNFYQNAINNAPLDIEILTNIIEQAAGDDDLTTNEYCELYGLALSKIQK